MKSISPLKNVLKKGVYGDYEAKNDEELTYLKNEGKIFTTGNTKAIIESKYQIESKNVLYILDNKELTSKFKSVSSGTDLMSSNSFKLIKFL